MIMIHLSLLMINSLIGVVLYRFLNKKRKKLTQSRRMAMVSLASILSLNIGMNIYFLLPENLPVIYFLTVIIGGLIGAIYSSLATPQTRLSGFYHGVIGGIMGTMLGAIIQNPSLCSLPSAHPNTIYENIKFFSTFGIFLMITPALLLFEGGKKL